MLGAEVSASLSPAQQVIKVVHEELVGLLGANDGGLRYADRPPTILMLCGLQGSGKTTTSVKLALLARRDGHRPVLVALDLRRPAAVEQLRTLADREKVAFHSPGSSAELAPEVIARQAVAEARRNGHDVVILDTAGRQAVDDELMDELRPLRAAGPGSVDLLVAGAMTSQGAVRVGPGFGEAPPGGWVVLTTL